MRGLRERQDLDLVPLDPITAAWMAAEAYQLYTLADVTDVTEGRSLPRCQVQPQQAVVE